MGPELTPLLRATAADAATFFAAVDPERLVEAVRETSDDELLELVGRDEIRSAAVEGILSRLHEYAVPDRLAAIDGTVRFDLERRGVLLQRCGLSFEHGNLKFLPALSADQPVDVVLRTSVLRLVRLVGGELNAGLEYLSGKLDIHGDVHLALALGGVFRLPGSGRIAVDPTALDPGDVARALADVKSDHLRMMMASGFRGVVLDEIFRRLPDFVNPRRARGADLMIGLRLLGNPTGEIERYAVRVRDGVATVTRPDEGAAGAAEDSEERCDATVTCEASDFLRLATGHLSAITGVLRGQLKVRGDKAKALQLSSIIDISGAR
ncbi:MAG: SCP2 sterol-binding domain-containing protein [Actinomycetota bacterium]|nr:SCP2 sterol-binding domain-containing protein [Actinomycetota bacterium]